MPITKQQNALMRAVRAKNVQQVKALLKQGVDPDFEDAGNQSPLEAAIAANSLPVVRALIEGGADINRENSETFDTPLDYAREQNKHRIATWLDAEGAMSFFDRSAFSGRYSRYDDYDDDDHYFDTSRKSARSSRKAKTRAAAKQPAKKLSEDFEDASAAPPKPKFTEESLKEIFNAKNWIGKPEEMQKLWEDVPAKLRKHFDFEAALAEAKRETLKKHAPQKMKLKPQAPPPNPPPPQTPPAAG